MSGIKPIETIYSGYRFRSRLEARWAVFFDALGIRYKYESEGYDLGGGYKYLPDFYLSNGSQGVWFEVKGREPSVKEIVRAKRLAAKSQSYVFVFHDQCWMPDPNNPNGLLCMPDGEEYPAFITSCVTCNAIDFDVRPFHWCSCGGRSTYDSSLLHRAFTAARQARFEHGESGFRA